VSLGVADLLQALTELRDRFELDSVSGTRRLADGEPIRLTVWAAGPPTIETGAGSIVLLDREELGR
jgi:hypothetical protein